MQLSERHGSPIWLEAVAVLTKMSTVNLLDRSYVHVAVHVVQMAFFETRGQQESSMFLMVLCHHMRANMNPAPV